MTEDIVRPSFSAVGVSHRLIRDGLIDEERPAFERQFREAMTAAAQTLDLTGVESLLRAWERIVALTEREGVEQRRRVLRRAAEIWRNRDNQDCAGRCDAVDVQAELTNEDQQRQAEANRARLHRQFEAGEPLTDSAGNPVGHSEPYCLVPLDELVFADRSSKG